MMVMQRFSLVVVATFGVLLAIESCKDMGNEAPPPSPTPIAISQSNFSLVPGETAATGLSGGTPPYSLVSGGNPNVVVPLIVGDSLKMQASSDWEFNHRYW